MANENFISTLVRNQFPSFYQEEGKNFLAFIEAYYEWMETDRGAIERTNTILENHDIDDSLNEFIEYFRKDIMPNVPDSIVADKRLLAKHIKDFYQSRGTLSAYKLLFRLIFNEDVEVNYPSDQILKVSDGDWRIDRYLIVVHDDNNYNLIGQTITGLESGANALVEDVIRRTIRGRDLDQLLLSNINGFFFNKEPIVPKSDIPDFISPNIEAGIQRYTIRSGGAEYNVGDKFKLISNKRGEFGKIIVTKTDDKKGVLTFSVVDGGSGYTASSGDFTSQSQIIIEGASGITPASFDVLSNDLEDLFAITICVTGPDANTVYGKYGPTVPIKNIFTGEVTGTTQMSTIRDIPVEAPVYGIPKQNEIVTSGIPYREHSNAVIQIANTTTISRGARLFGATSGANADVKDIQNDTAGSSNFIVDGFKNFAPGETVLIGTTSGDSVGTVLNFSGNTIGHHIVTVGNAAGQTISLDDQLVGDVSGAVGVVKKIITVEANGYSRGVGGADDLDLLYLTVTSNTTSNASSYFGTGAMRHYVPNEGLRKNGSSDLFGNVATFTANTEYKNQYTPLGGLLVFVSTTIGSIDSLSNIVGGSGYKQTPSVTIVEPSIKALGIGESYMTVQNLAPNWGTGNSQITTIDSNDRVRAGGAAGDVKSRVTSRTYANNTSELVLRVWQDELQRYPGNVNYSNGQIIAIDFYDSADQTNRVAVGSAKIVSYDDKGILGDNAEVSVGLGANGSITALKVIDSGFSYEDEEVVEVEEGDSPLAQRAEIEINLKGVANAEGYYTSSRSHISSKSGFIQDSRFYQEYSYEVLAPLALERYKDVAKLLVHPAGQALFGRYVSSSEVDVNANTIPEYQKRISVNSTVQVTNGTPNLVFSSNVFSSFSNGDYIVIQTGAKAYQKALLNIVNANGTFANITSTWNLANNATANVYYITGSIT